MKFYHPYLLYGLVFLFLPIIIHLFGMKKSVRVHFSNVQFLKEIQQTESSRRKLKEKLVLLMRMLAIAFVVFAFARPYFPKKGELQMRRKAVSIFIDNSFSMEAINKEGDLLSQAKGKAKALVANFGPNDRFQLLTQDFEGKDQRLLSKQEFLDEVDKVQLTGQSRSIKQILARQRDLLNMHPETNRLVYLLSDFQKGQISDQDSINADVSVNLIRLESNATANVAVDSAWLSSAVHRPGVSEELFILLHNYGDKMAEKVPVKVIINGQQKAIGNFSIEPNSVQTDTLRFSGLTTGWQKVNIQLEDNPITFDNQFYLTFQVRDKLPVLSINGAATNRYLDALFSTEPFFQLTESTYGNVDYAKLGSFPIVFVADLRSIPAGLGQQLQGYVQSGGTLVVFPADKADLASYRSFLQPLGVSFPDLLISEKQPVQSLNLKNPVFGEIFSEVPQTPDLPYVKKFYRLSDGKKVNEETLMDLPGGNPLLTSFTCQHGKVYVCSVALNEDFGNFQEHGLFVPLMFRMVLLSGHNLPMFYTIGKDENAKIPHLEVVDKAPLKLSNDSLSIIPDFRQVDNGTRLYFSDQIRTAGIYDLERGDSLLGELAFNNNRRESNLHYLSDKDLRSFLGNHYLHLTSDSSSLTKKKANSENETGGWEPYKICLVLGLLFLILEIILVNFYRSTQLKKPTIIID